jgi:hypothetical protein
MPLGLSVLELLLVLLVLGAPVGIVVLLVKSVARRSGDDRALGADQHMQLKAELDSAQMRLEELEAKLARAEEKASFTESLLTKPARQFPGSPGERR